MLANDEKLHLYGIAIAVVLHTVHWRTMLFEVVA